MDKILARRRRHKRIRKKIFGTTNRPRLVVFRSLRHIYAQIIDDVKGTILLSASTLSKEVREKINYGGNVEAARVVGGLIAKKARRKRIKKVVFDRGGYSYHGRVQALAQAAREKGLKF
jgi:large subunit ribosomal protein L18